MDNKWHDLKTDVLSQVERLKARVILADRYDDWYAIYNRLNDLNDTIDRVIRPYLYEDQEDK